TPDWIFSTVVSSCWCVGSSAWPATLTTGRLPHHTRPVATTMLTRMGRMIYLLSSLPQQRGKTVRSLLYREQIGSQPFQLDAAERHHHFFSLLRRAQLDKSIAEWLTADLAPDHTYPRTRALRHTKQPTPRVGRGTFQALHINPWTHGCLMK